MEATSGWRDTTLAWLDRVEAWADRPRQERKRSARSFVLVVLVAVPVAMLWAGVLVGLAAAMVRWPLSFGVPVAFVLVVTAARWAAWLMRD